MAQDAIQSTSQSRPDRSWWIWRAESSGSQATQSAQTWAVRATGKRKPASLGGLADIDEDAIGDGLGAGVGKNHVLRPEERSVVAGKRVVTLLGAG
jgi:hypothetical protein